MHKNRVPSMRIRLRLDLDRSVRILLPEQRAAESKLKDWIAIAGRSATAANTNRHDNKAIVILQGLKAEDLEAS
jgi:hypothetical protein